MAHSPGLFDLDERYAALSTTGDPLERLASVVDSGMFRTDLDAALRRSDRRKGGRRPMDGVLMFKVLVLQSLYRLADEQTEFQIRDRLSFMRFVDLDLHGRVPDARTTWLFREHLTKAKAVDALSARFDAHLKKQGFLAMGGQMIEASIIEAPRQRNTDAEKGDLKAGRIPEDWAAKPSKLRQKDRDGRWTLKRGRRKRRPDRTLVQRQVGNRSARPIILRLKALELSELVGSHAEILIAPGIEGLLGYLHFADRIHPRHPLAALRLNLP